jgi:hypothetical protein
MMARATPDRAQWGDAPRSRRAVPCWTRRCAAATLLICLTWVAVEALAHPHQTSAQSECQACRTVAALGTGESAVTAVLPAPESAWEPTPDTLSSPELNVVAPVTTRGPPQS